MWLVTHREGEQISILRIIRAGILTAGGGHCKYGKGETRNKPHGAN